jgi:hypothetical protein
MKCKVCGVEIPDDGYDYDFCIGCHAERIGCAIRVLDGCKELNDCEGSE